MKVFKDKCCRKDLFPLDYASLQKSYSALVSEKKIKSDLQKKLAYTGLSLHHLELSFKRDAESGVKSILQEHGFQQKTAAIFCKLFAEKEE